MPSFLKHKLDPTIKRRFGFHLPEIMPFLQEEVRFQHRILGEIQCFHQLLLKMMGQGRIGIGKQVFFQVLEDFVPICSGILQELITGIILFEQPMRRLKILEETLLDHGVSAAVREAWVKHSMELIDQITGNAPDECHPED